jgi:hypothetical protein
VRDEVLPFKVIFGKMFSQLQKFLHRNGRMRMCEMKSYPLKKFLVRFVPIIYLGNPDSLHKLYTWALRNNKNPLNVLKIKPQT